MDYQHLLREQANKPLARKLIGSLICSFFNYRPFLELDYSLAIAPYLSN
jgi:hypothetical protein